MLNERKICGLYIATIISFFAAFTLCSLLVVITIMSRANVEKLQMEKLISEKSRRIHEVISRLLYRTEALSVLVIHGSGDIKNFDEIAPAITDDPAILNVLIAPDGIVSKVYPHNERLVGLDFFNEDAWAGNKEAIAAKESGKLVLGGPFIVAQGVTALVGRKPVYIDTQNEKRTFWGLVSITLKFPEAMDDAKLEILELNGFAYELWRTNPDTNERQVIAHSYKHANPQARYIEKQVTILNADWHLRVAPVRMWYSYPESMALIAAGLLISYLVALVAQKSCRLQGLVITDSLTGVYTRHYFMEASRISMKRSRRLNAEDFILIFDIDRFKNINDTYGHAVGDEVLVETASRIRATLRPYDLFARYGGEEFVIYASGIGCSDAYELAERLRLSICNQEFKYGDICFVVTASFGIAKIGEDQDIEKAIKEADEAMYVAKKEGRNKVKMSKA